jgi:hypothetical protein
MGKTTPDLLKDRFPANHVDAALGHYNKLVEDFQRGDWEGAIGKGGKFLEAALKAVWVHVGETVPSKDFKVGLVIDQLASKTSFEDSIRLTVPRACRIVYDIASNRGGRHDPNEINPNEMDAAVVVANCSWILAELLRYSQKGALDQTVVKDLVAGLVQKKYPWLEDIDGRVRFYLTGLSAREIALLLLWRSYPNRIKRKDLIVAVQRHQVSGAGAAMAVSRLKGVVDEDGDGKLRLLLPGLEESEQIIARTTQKK